MYSPKIRSDLIPYLYHLARFLRIPMTTVVNTVLEEVIESLKGKGYFVLFRELEQQRRLEKRLEEYFQDTLRRKEAEDGRIDGSSWRRAGKESRA